MLNSKTTTTVRIAQTEYLLNCSSSMYMTSETMAKDKPALTAKITLRRSERPISYNLEATSLDQLWKLMTPSESASRKERLGAALSSSSKSLQSFLERSLSLLFSKKLCLNDPTLAGILSDCCWLFIAKKEGMMEMMRQRAFLDGTVEHS